MVREVIGAVLVAALGCAAEGAEKGSTGGAGGSPGGSGSAGTTAAGGAGGSGATGGEGGSGGEVGVGGTGGAGGQDIQVGCAQRSADVGTFASPADWANAESEWCILPSVSDEYGCSFFEAKSPEAWREDLQWVDCGVGCQKLELGGSNLGEPTSHALSTHHGTGTGRTFVRVAQRVSDITDRVVSVSRYIDVDGGRVIAASMLELVRRHDLSVCSIASRRSLALHQLIGAGPPDESPRHDGWSSVLADSGRRIWRPGRVDNGLASWDAFDTDVGTVLLPAGGGLRALPVEGDEFFIESGGGFISGAGAGERAWWLSYVGPVASLWSWSPGDSAEKHVDFEKPTCDLDATPTTVSGWSSTGGCVEMELSDLYFWTASATAPSEVRMSESIQLPGGLQVSQFATSDRYAAAMVQNSVSPTDSRIWLIDLADFSVREIPVAPPGIRIQLTMTSRYVYAGDKGRVASNAISTLYRYDLEQIEHWSIALP